MTGKCNLQLCTVELLATALLLLVTHSLSVPLYKRSEDGSGANLEVQNIEKLYTTVLEKVHFQRTNLTLELTGNLYETHVCPVFEIYSRMEQMQLLLPENNDTFSLLSFISKTQAQALCARVKAQCSEDQQCHNMSCNISSIAETCLNLVSPWGQMVDLWGMGQENMKPSILVPFWLNELLVFDEMSLDMKHSLQTLLMSGLAVTCTFPPYEVDETQAIEC